MERFTKIAVVLWLCAAVALQAWLFRFWATLPWLTLAAAVGSLILVRVDRRAIGGVLVVAYVFHALVQFFHGSQSVHYAVIWMGALLGAMLPDALRTSWHIPTRWRGALICAALVVMWGSALILWRETDGNVSMLLDYDPRTWSWQGSVPPRFVLTWIVHVSIVLVLGIVWFDWLLGATGLDFERTVVTPLVVSATVMAVASVYQMFVDIDFLNATVYAARGRATGTMFDANVAGTLASLWLGGVFLWAVRLPGWPARLMPYLMALLALAVWGSGSRTALAIAVLVTSVILFEPGRGGQAFPRRRAVIGLACVLGVLGGIAAIGAVNPYASNPGARAWQMVRSLGTPEAVVRELWNRNGYGTVAVEMVRQYPIAGVGIGNYNAMAAGFGKRVGVHVVTDNAQNWLRHQVAEFGLVGALGWMVWFVMFALFVLVPKRGDTQPVWIARAMIVGFGLISQLGVPGQDAMVAITFWTLACWYTGLVGAPPSARALGFPSWLAIGVILVVFTLGTTRAAANELRLPERIRAAGGLFSYGFGEPAPDGANAGFRPTLRRAVALLETDRPWTAVSVRLQPLAPGARPVEVRVSRDGEVVLKANLADDHVVEGFIASPALGERMMLEVVARHRGAAGYWPFTRDVGLLVKWDFVDEVPARFRAYGPRGVGGQP